jgi:phospholipid/cholesterol/gamma-HCH transport system permease protein
MRVNEQIDAMRVMAVNPHGYLVAPRILASVIMLPLLTCIFILTGVFTAFLIGISFFDIDIGTFFEKMRWMVKTKYIFQGMTKGAVFGFILAAIGCYKGFYAGGGAKGVGRATTEAVVISLVAILVSDYFISYLQFDQVF